MRLLQPGLRLPFSIQAQDALLTNTWGQQGPWEGAKNSTTGNGEAFSKSLEPCYCSSVGLRDTHGLAPPFSKTHPRNKRGGLGGLLHWVGSCSGQKSHKQPVLGAGLRNGQAGSTSTPSCPL